MSFEQLDNERNSQEKKRKKIESDKKQQFFLEKQILWETSNMLNSLARQISKEFWIDINEVKKLISGETLWDLSSLKSHVWNKEGLNYNDLQNAISKAKGSIEDLSKQKRESLKASLETDSYSPEYHKYHVSEKLIPKTLLNRAKNPASIWDELIWVWLGIVDSTEAVILFSYALGKWVLLTPYHLYLILTWQAKYEWFKRI